MSDTDLELLARYTRHHAEDAFTEIVRRHLNLVHSAALRQVHSPQLAEEVAQSTFINLARHAHRLAADTNLTAWLYQVTRREAIDVVRREARRQVREQIATEMNAINATAADWTHIEPLLDEAMHALGDTDRTAVLLRYFENKSLREVGQALGTSDDAAQKRVGRAVERLRRFFARRGVTVGGTGLVVVISANAVQAAPVGLAVTISTATALATTVSTATAAVTKAMPITALQKSLVALTIAAIVGTGIYEASKGSSLKTVRLADGRQIVLKGLTYGKNHRYVLGNPLAKTLVYLGATNWAAQLGAKTFSDPFSDPKRRLRGFSTNSDLLMVWIELRGTNVGTNSGLIQTVATVLDVDGHESGRNSFTTASTAPGVAFYGFPISSFPRRDKMFVVRFWEVVKADFIPLAEFKVQNPAHGSSVFSVPEPLPIERHAGDEVFALVGLNSGMSATGLVKQQHGEMWTEVLFRIGTNEPGFQGTNTRTPWNWAISRIELSDATGNFAGGADPPQGRIVWQTTSNFMSRLSDGVANVPGFLWTNEPAWKIRAEFERSKPAPAELWVVRGITLPPPGSYIELNLRTQIHDVPLTLKVIASANARFPGEKKQGLQDRPKIHLEFDPGTNGFQFSLREAVDQQGRRIQHPSIPSPRGERAFSLQTSPESTNVDLTFALRRNYVLEFIAKPSLLLTNLNHWAPKSAVASE